MGSAQVSSSSGSCCKYPTEIPSPIPPTIALALPTLQAPPLDTPITVSTLAPNVTPSGTPVLTRVPSANTFVIGQSAGGRDILAWRFGTGSKVLLLVGGNELPQFTDAALGALHAAYPQGEIGPGYGAPVDGTARAVQGRSPPATR